MSRKSRHQIIWIVLTVIVAVMMVLLSVSPVLLGL